MTTVDTNLNASFATDISPSAFAHDSWQVLQTLGKGGQGCVLWVQNLDNGEDAALKVLEPACDFDGSGRMLFRNEERVLRILAGSPHIIALHPDHDFERGDHELLLELVEGGSLERLPGVSLPYPQVLRIALGALEGLAAAHQKGIIHRDVKPANILLDRRGEPTLIDWGISTNIREPDNTADNGGLVSCTPLYMAPEQADERGDPRTDLYSLGCSLYELLTGVRAFGPGRECGALELMLLHRERDGPNPRRRNRLLPRGFAEIIERSMKREPLKRFQTATEMRDALRWYLQPAWKRFRASFDFRTWFIRGSK